MPRGIIRIYEGVSKDSDLMGTTTTANEVIYGGKSSFERNPARAFLFALGHASRMVAEHLDPDVEEKKRRYNATVIEFPADTILSQSDVYLEIKPPMDSDTIDKFVTFLHKSGIGTTAVDHAVIIDHRPGQDNMERHW